MARRDVIMDDASGELSKRVVTGESIMWRTRTNEFKQLQHTLADYLEPIIDYHIDTHSLVREERDFWEAWSESFVKTYSEMDFRKRDKFFNTLARFVAPLKQVRTLEMLISFSEEEKLDDVSSDFKSLVQRVAERNKRKLPYAEYDLFYNFVENSPVFSDEVIKKIPKPAPTANVA